MTPSGLATRSVVVVSQRSRISLPANTAYYEFEDLILNWEQASLASIVEYFPSRRFSLLRHIGKLGSQRRGEAATARFIHPPEPLPNDPIDLVFFVASTPFDLWSLGRLLTQRDHIDRLVVYLAEAWPIAINNRALAKEPWHLIDHLFVGIKPTAETFASALPCPVSFLPWGVDTMAFSAAAGSGSIAVMNPGRRHQPQHDALLQASRRHNRPYLFDTMSGTVTDPQAHRAQYVHLLNHSEVMIANRAKFDQPRSTGDAAIAPLRVLEALSAGCAIAGDGIAVDALHDVGLTAEDLRPFPFTPSTDHADELFSLHATPQERRRRQQLMRRHADWAHRWLFVLETLGWAPTPGHRERLEHLTSAAP